MAYEVVTFQVLREQLRCKEIWVVGADSWRNPDDDLPADFEARRIENHCELRKPLDPTVFIDDLSDEMATALTELHAALPTLGWLEIAERAAGAIKLTKFDAAHEPRGLRRTKNEVQRRWGTVPLIDMLKEAVLRTGCLNDVTAVAGTGTLRVEVLAERSCWPPTRMAPTPVCGPLPRVAVTTTPRRDPVCASPLPDIRHGRSSRDPARQRDLRSPLGAVTLRPVEPVGPDRVDLVERGAGHRHDVSVGLPVRPQRYKHRCSADQCPSDGPDLQRPCRAEMSPRGEQLDEAGEPFILDLAIAAAQRRRRGVDGEGAQH